MHRHSFPYPYVLVFGAARSGVGAAHLLRHYNIGVTVVDEKPAKEFRSLIRRFKRLGVTWYFGGWDKKAFEQVRAVVVSPGIPLDHPLINMARALHLPVISEVELASYFTDTKILAITGTNGKTTATTVTGQILTDSGFSAIVAGNIGRAFSDAVLSSVQDVQPEPRVLVTEISSFQLESIQRFRPFGAALLNVTRDHIDRYPSIREYIQAKYRITQNQGPADFLVLNHDDPFCLKLAEQTRADVLFFSATQEVEKGAFAANGTIYLRENGKAYPVCPTSDVPMPGTHNVENVLASLVLCRRLGVEPEQMVRSLRKFKGVEHRIEYVGERNGVSFWNDSKATNVDSLEKALMAFDRPIVLLAGGRDKRSSYDRLNQLVKSKVKTLVLMGEAADLINAAWGSLVPTIRVKSMEDAVKQAASKASSGDIVLLSPACSSFDMFKDYEERGRTFKRCVRAVLEARTGKA